MSEAVAVQRMHAWGVRTIYGYPGDGINGVSARSIVPVIRCGSSRNRVGSIRASDAPIRFAAHLKS